MRGLCLPLHLLHSPPTQTLVGALSPALGGSVCSHCKNSISCNIKLAFMFAHFLAQQLRIKRAFDLKQILLIAIKR